MCTHVAARKGRSLASAVYTQLHLTRRLWISLDSSDEWWNLWAPSTRGRLQELEESCGHDRPIGPPGLRMKSGTTGSVSSRSDHSAASSHSTPPPATMVFIITMWENMSFCFASASGTSSRTPSTERKCQGFDFGLGLKKQDYQFVPALPRGAGDLQIELARMFIYDGFASCVRRK